MINLGPRIISYKTDDGIGEILIHIELLEPTIHDLGGGESITDFRGIIIMDCPLFNRKMQLVGEDELQLIMRCLWMSDIWLQRVCRENNILIYKIKPGDIDEDLAVYRP